MAALKIVFYLGVCLSAFIITTADTNVTPPSAGNVRWTSQDFKTVLSWTAPSDHTYTVLYAEVDKDWHEIADCTDVPHSDCDLTNVLNPLDRSYTANIKTELLDPNYDYLPEDAPHTISPPFNPYKQSNISAVEFTVEIVDGTRAILNITDPLSAIHQRGKQLTIRDVLKKDLKYKISYYKAGSTGKRDSISDSSSAEVSGLDAGYRYCFIVAAFIPTRPKNNQHGALSEQKCAGKDDAVPDLSIGAWVGIIFILLTVLIIIVTVTVLCCKCCQQRNKSLQTSQQSSAPI